MISRYVYWFTRSPSAFSADTTTAFTSPAALMASPPSPLSSVLPDSIRPCCPCTGVKGACHGLGSVACLTGTLAGAELASYSFSPLYLASHMERMLRSMAFTMLRLAVATPCAATTLAPNLPGPSGVSSSAVVRPPPHCLEIATSVATIPPSQ
eukprot:CAMPEP_0174330692 /NCGR_PEP_ID=MMETSP0810-20121108/16879_1 /TAXON_ID=73025 ORGANISM="Eutreptiella gymnastica-like, Strain CCMP1594" /NCGR_SAMPLE_ID=MMETSP0810 /ASSEMBLY_ACC=CAM_ASM_000659 /LENGTH=152 /DNA_ID=CAMNT_0015446009 /DNA_START=289 /DNA_END=747 /DNA_ORIENTATION=+